MLLAFSPALPAGDTADRIEMHVALTADGQIDGTAFLADRRSWKLVRDVSGAPPTLGEVVHVDGGWAVLRPGDDDPVWLLDARRFRPGDYVTVRGPAKGHLIFRVVGVDQA